MVDEKVDALQDGFFAALKTVPALIFNFPYLSTRQLEDVAAKQSAVAEPFYRRARANADRLKKRQGG